MIKAKTWSGRDLRGAWSVTLKLDGVRALSNGRRVVSKQGKPLFNLDNHADAFTDVEVWLGDWETTAGAVRASVTKHRILRSHLYALDPPDRRLHLGVVVDPTAAQLKALLKTHTRAGCDGLVLRQDETWLKVKHAKTYDVEVTGIKPGAGRHVGRIGALLTQKGRVGTGFSDAERDYSNNWIGKVIEVECLGLTAASKFRHARFVRVRFDKRRGQ